MKARSTLIDDIEQLLGDSSNVVFAAADVGVQLDNAVKEASTIYPLEFPIWLTARHKSRDVECLRTNIQRQNSDYAVYPILLKDTNGLLLDDNDLYRNKRNITWGFGGFNLKLDYSPNAREDDKLTGTSTFTSASTAVTGSGTAYTSELRVGYFIRKSTEWYRVAAIASDTALTLGRNAVAADDGASSSVGYWRSDVVLMGLQNHYLTSQTDIAGTIDAGVAGGYSDGVWMIHVDALGTGTIDAGTFLSIAGTEGVYRVTTDATIGTNECDLWIEPALKDRAVENAVVTLYSSSMDTQLERIVEELGAAQCLRNWTYDARTQWDAAVTSLASAATEIGLSNAEFDKAVIEAALINPEVDSAKTEIQLINPEVDQSLTDTDTARSTYANKVNTASGFEHYMAIVNSVLSGAQGYASSGNGFLNLANGYRSSTSAFTGTGGGFLGTAGNYLRKASLEMNAVNVQLALKRVGDERYGNALRELRGLTHPRTNKMFSRA